MHDSFLPDVRKGVVTMSILIKGMEMPTTGLYFVGVDNAGGRDKTVVTVERMLGNRDVRQIVGSFELVPVPAHGRLIDAEKIYDAVEQRYRMSSGIEHRCERDLLDLICAAPTIIEAKEETT